MYVLDSDILSLVHSGHERVGQRREDVDPADVATTVISKAEILRARCEFLLKAADAEQRTTRFSASRGRSPTWTTVTACDRTI
jgi:hypothetical protein